MRDTRLQSYTPVSVVKLIRRVRGGSQAALVRGDDNRTYILKLGNNPQGPNVLANEFLASRIARAVGLPVAETTLVTVSKSFLNENPSLTLETRHGSYPPKPGVHLGCAYVGDIDATHRAIEWLRPSDFGRIANLRDFLGMYLFDVWALQEDNRQAIFMVDPRTKTLQATFIDNGHLFGGPDWKRQPRRYVACHRNRSLYDGLWSKGAVRSWTKVFQQKVPKALSSAALLVPVEWYSGDLSAMTESLLRRLANLQIIFDQHSLERVEAGRIANVQEATLQAGAAAQ